jgi:hypothetical protein
MKKMENCLTLADIYDKQGFNAKPKLVSSKSCLLKLDCTLKHSDGTPILLYRGDSDKRFTNQFKGLGPKGSIHYPNKGVCGGGTYAASSVDPEANPKKSVDEKGAIDTALFYADKSNPYESIVVFSIKENGRVAQFDSMDSFSEWGSFIRNEAEIVTGIKFDDTGCAAALLGYDAIRIPVSEESIIDLKDYWMVFNRGIVVAAIDHEFS